MSGRSHLFVGRLPIDVRERDVENVFEKYGRLVRCDVKYGTGTAYAFVDYDDRRDAEDALKYENGREIRGQSIVVEWARGPSYRPSIHMMKSGGGRSRSTYDQCYHCQRSGHWARDCPKLERDRYYPRRRRSRSHSRRERSYSRSRSRDNRSRRRSRSRSGENSKRYRSKTRSRTPSHSRSNSREQDGEKRNNSERDYRSKSRSPSKSHSPSPENNREKSPSPSEENSQEDKKVSNRGEEKEENDWNSRDESRSRSRSRSASKSPIVSQNGSIDRDHSDGDVGNEHLDRQSSSH
ncbi:uncharacterized protein LOC143247392 [Tachypleus tridentatus]|uniref:uncharacterized protein LOC143247392 n=1 Tax=Tachypleus tridentatus TaxID=6853 RepID=UPI003FCF5DFD